MHWKQLRQRIEAQDFISLKWLAIGLVAVGVVWAAVSVGLRETPEEVRAGVISDLNDKLEPIYFATASDELSDEATGRLDDYITLLKDAGANELLIEGFPDHGADTDRSHKRVEAVRSYLRSQGLGLKIKIVAYGPDRPEGPESAVALRVLQ